MGMQEETRMKRIGMLTSGGDCQALNAAMRGVVKGLSENVDELEIYGFLNGYLWRLQITDICRFFRNTYQRRNDPWIFQTAV